MKPIDLDALKPTFTTKVTFSADNLGQAERRAREIARHQLARAIFELREDAFDQLWPGLCRLLLDK